MSTRKREWSRTTLIVGLFSLLAAGSWIGFDVYRSLVKTTLPTVLQSQLLPLQTTIDEDTISNLRSRTGYTQTALDQVQSVPAEAPTGIPSPVAESLTQQVTPSPEATSSATPQAAQAGGEPTATASAQIQL